MNKRPRPQCCIRALKTSEEIAPVVTIQRAIWPGSDIEIAPGHVLLTAAHNGGLVAGAFIGDQLVGFIFGFPGLHEDDHGPRLKHCSHMLGVHPDFQGLGIGVALKIYQREFALRQGLALITWTYDPLLARNAHLNIARLGAVCNTYLQNLYGDLSDDLNAGLPTDRFQVDWWISTPRVTERIQHWPVRGPRLADYLSAGALFVNPLSLRQERMPSKLLSGALANRPIVLVNIPANFLALKITDPVLALRWRLSTRAAFQALFRQGYVVTDFICEPSPAPSAAYVLSQPETTRESS